MLDQFSTYLYQKRGFYYFSRRVPKEVQHCHLKQRIVLALNTRSRAKALKYSQVICQRLDERWLPMRLDALGFGNVMANDVKSPPSPKLSEATQQYIKLRGMGKAKTFHQTAIRNSNVVIEILGDRNLREYSTVDAGKVRDALIKQGLNILSVKRTFITIRAIFNLAIAENGLNMRNSFASVYMPEGDIKKRVSIPIDTIREIQQACYRTDDDMRWLVALISDTGMRLAEAAGLHIDDLHLDEEVPYVDIRPHPWRSLKTKGSQRHIPLIGASLWAALRIKENGSSCYAFSRYTDDRQCRANAASNTCNDDAGADMFIDAVENALKDWRHKDHRHTIIHGQTLRDDQLDQIARLGMSVSFFSAHIYYCGDLHDTAILGPARTERISPAASAQQRGIRFTIHNDASVTPTRPLHLAHCAVERQTYGGRILGEAQKISRLSALRAMTIDAAWQVFEDTKRGSIENGKLADLVILSENPLETSKSLSDICVMQTIRRGTIAYQA